MKISYYMHIYVYGLLVQIWNAEMRSGVSQLAKKHVTRIYSLKIL